MNKTDVEDLFAPLMAVQMKRMFSGFGVYRDGQIFALLIAGSLFLKTDEETRAAFEGAGSVPFAYRKGTKDVTTSYWSLPDEAFDDADLLARFTHLAFEAADRAGPSKRGGAASRPRRASLKE